MPQIKVFVINLKRSEKRRSYMENLLAPLGLQYEFIEAVDGNELRNEEISEAQIRGNEFKKGFRYRKPFAAGEMGCALSHLKAYEKVVNDNLDYACILEDDIRIDHPQALRYILSEHNLLAIKRAWDVDFIYLFVSNSGLENRFSAYFPKVFWNSVFWKTKLTDSISLCRTGIAPWGAGAYLVNKRACEVFLREGNPIKMPSDALLKKSNEFGLKQYILNPVPVSHCDEVVSVIDPSQTERFYVKPKSSFLTNIFNGFGFLARLIFIKSGIIIGWYGVRRMWNFRRRS